MLDKMTELYLPNSYTNSIYQSGDNKEEDTMSDMNTVFMESYAVLIESACRFNCCNSVSLIKRRHGTEDTILNTQTIEGASPRHINMSVRAIVKEWATLFDLGQALAAELKKNIALGIDRFTQSRRCSDIERYDTAEFLEHLKQIGLLY